MKSLRYLVVLTLLFAGLASQAQFRFGVKVGMNVNSLKFNESVFDSNNRAGFTGGVMAEFTVPLIGIGADVSAMYVRRNTQWLVNNDITTDNRDYIEIPINLKYKFTIPAVAQIVKPYIMTGPSFSFLTSRKHIEGALENKSVDVAWNIGLGVELLNHLQVSASYGLGLSKAIKTVGVADDLYSIDGKNRYWTITAAYLF